MDSLTPIAVHERHVPQVCVLLVRRSAGRESRVAGANKEFAFRGLLTPDALWSGARFSAAKAARLALSVVDFAVPGDLLRGIPARALSPSCRSGDYDPCSVRVHSSPTSKAQRLTTQRDTHKTSVISSNGHGGDYDPHPTHSLACDRPRRSAHRISVGRRSPSFQSKQADRRVPPDLSSFRAGPDRTRKHQRSGAHLELGSEGSEGRCDQECSQQGATR